MQIRTIRCDLRSLSPMSQSRYYKEEKLDGEQPDSFEERTWRERMHTDDSDQVFVPPMALKLALDSAATYLGKRIPGQGTKTWTKKFQAGLMCVTPMLLNNWEGDPILGDDVEGKWLFVPSDGVKGGGKRVERCFPEIPQWVGQAEFLLMDQIIEEAVFTEHLGVAGALRGLGRFRPERQGFYGRFEIVSIDFPER